MSVDPAIAGLVVGCMALLFGSAAVHKFRDLKQFDEVYAAYRLLPWGSRAVPAMEALVAAGLLATPTRGAAIVVGTLVLCTYAAAIAVNLLRGRRDLACGCGGPQDRRPIAGWMIWRNLLMAAVLGAVLLPWSERAWSATDALTVGLGTATLSLVYLCVDGLLALRNRGISGVSADPGRSS